MVDLSCVNVQLLAHGDREILEVLLDLVHHGELGLVAPSGAVVAVRWRRHCKMRSVEWMFSSLWLVCRGLRLAFFPLRVGGLL